MSLGVQEPQCRLSGLALSFLVAAVVTTPFGLADAVPRLQLSPVLRSAGLALIMPLLSF